MSSVIDSIRERIARFPRLARFVAVAGLLALVAVPLSNVVPRSLVIRYDFGPGHHHVQVLRVAYLPVGQASTRVITQRFPEGAPRQFDHAVDLAPGRYELHARIETPGGMREFEEFITVGRQAVVEVTFDPDAP